MKAMLHYKGFGEHTVSKSGCLFGGIANYRVSVLKACYESYHNGKHIVQVITVATARAVQ